MSGRLLKHKRKLAFKIAESILDEWPNITAEGFDLDEATEIVDLYLPLTRAEADEEIEKLKRPCKKSGPSVIAELREAMGISGGLGDLVGRAAIRIKNHDAQLSAVTKERDELREALANCEAWSRRAVTTQECVVACQQIMNEAAAALQQGDSA